MIDYNNKIFDIVDNFNSLRRHYYTRKKVYESSGGKILKFSKENVKDYIIEDEYDEYF